MDIPVDLPPPPPPPLPFRPYDSGEKKGIWNLGVEYLTSATSGAAHLFCTIDTAAKFFPETALTSKVRTYAASTGSVLCIPQFVEYVDDLKDNIYKLCDAKALPESDLERSNKIFKAALGTATTSVDIVNCSAEFTLFLHDAEILPLGEAVPATEGIFQVTSAISDGVDLFATQIYKIGKYQNKLEATQVEEEKSYFQQKIYRTIIQIAKDILSISLAALALVSLFFAALLEGVVFIPPLVLGLSALYIVAKVTSYFYQMILKEEKKHLFT